MRIKEQTPPTYKIEGMAFEELHMLRYGLRARINNLHTLPGRADEIKKYESLIRQFNNFLENRG